MKAGRKKEDYFGAVALSYLGEKLAEILTGQLPAELTNLAVQWGKDYEKEAIELVSEKKGIQIEHFGGENLNFFPFNLFSGASPDGLSSTHLIEVKCPFNSKNHIEVLLASKREDFASWMKENRYEYFIQMQFGMLCTQKDKAYFASYNPKMIDSSQKLVVGEIKKRGSH
jgi:hypothetical protein